MNIFTKDQGISNIVAIFIIVTVVIVFSLIFWGNILDFTQDYHIDQAGVTVDEEGEMTLISKGNADKVLVRYTPKNKTDEVYQQTYFEKVGETINLPFKGYVQVLGESESGERTFIKQNLYINNGNTVYNNPNTTVCTSTNYVCVVDDGFTVPVSNATVKAIRNPTVATTKTNQTGYYEFNTSEDYNTVRVEKSNGEYIVGAVKNSEKQPSFIFNNKYEKSPSSSIIFNKEKKIYHTIKSNNKGYILNLEQLQGLTRTDLTNINYNLYNDINANDTRLGRGFEPINLLRENKFKGNNNTIKNIYINRESNTGIFSFNLGTIKYLNVRNSEIIGYHNTGTLTGRNGGNIKNINLNNQFVVGTKGSKCVGGLSGSNEGNIKNVYVGLNVFGDKKVGGVAGCNANGNIELIEVDDKVEIDGNETVGGVVGDISYGAGGSLELYLSDLDYDQFEIGGGEIYYGVIDTPDLNNNNYCTIETNYNNKNNLKLLSDSDNNPGVVKDVKFEGTVSGRTSVGGILGINNGIIEEADMSGNVNGEEKVGGVTGSNTGIIENVNNTADVYGEEKVGGVTGNNTGDVINSTNEGTVSGDNKTGGIVGYNEGVVYNNDNKGEVITSNNEENIIVGDNNEDDQRSCVKNNEDNNLNTDLSGKVAVVNSLVDEAVVKALDEDGNVITTNTTNDEGFYNINYSDNIESIEVEITDYNTEEFDNFTSVYVRELSDVQIIENVDNEYNTNIKLLDTNTDKTPVYNDINFTFNNIITEDSYSTSYTISEAEEKQIHIQKQLENINNGQYNIMSNIDINNFTTISNFKGNINGNNYKVNGLNSVFINNNEGNINNLIFNNVNINKLDNSGVIIENYGSLTNLTVSGVIGGSGDVGGLVSINNGVIDNNKFEGSFNVNYSEVDNIGNIVGVDSTVNYNIINATSNNNIYEVTYKINNSNDHKIKDKIELYIEEDKVYTSEELVIENNKILNKTITYDNNTVNNNHKSKIVLLAVNEGDEIAVVRERTDETIMTIDAEDVGNIESIAEEHNINLDEGETLTLVNLVTGEQVSQHEVSSDIGTELPIGLGNELLVIDPEANQELMTINGDDVGKIVDYIEEYNINNKYNGSVENGDTLYLYNLGTQELAGTHTVSSDIGIPKEKITIKGNYGSDSIKIEK